MADQFSLAFPGTDVRLVSPTGETEGLILPPGLARDPERSYAGRWNCTPLKDSGSSHATSGKCDHLFTSCRYILLYIANRYSVWLLINASQK